ncbi:MAG: hypothetical protein HETSPECPRED_002008 [Heterodermia speciosa]|uniref:Uncharacterized protein n=1 Tax=Heterodermia speciosa TaxID=116794 RepID=A0A8H3IDK0_9LECA|nr:MAG: hypothetical protein HETSPECPRED_002008 [Heterodermia speciosa]
MVAAIGADREIMDQTSLEYVLYNSLYTNKMFKTYFGGIAEAIHRTIFALGGGPNNSHVPDAEMYIPGGRLPYELVKYHKRLQLLMSNLYMQATVALQDPQCLGFFEHIQRDVVQQRMPGSAAISYIPMSPQPVYQGIGTWYLHDDQNPGNRPPQYSSQSIPQYTPASSPLSEKTTIYRNTPTQSPKGPPPMKPSQFLNRRRKGRRNDKAQSAVPVATREQR